ncbi:hypothetical protein SALGADO_42 [Arthrobacter phage Salgado]|uniref:Uncharacterized protein n=1 Tax=Arthrobacter phage Salgado TaxID=1772314 RepID=A0A0U4K162_9CAUD|nr:hypothetical protein KMD22_gp42 [Arthrobacter phage Salgado]ALY10210.1 hypothetical protein SALGADO_42 [Arthrobacter phage Salgado]
MKKIITIKAEYIKDGDEIKTDEGWVKTGGIQPLGTDRVGILSPDGMIGVPAAAMVTVRREEG